MVKMKPKKVIAFMLALSLLFTTAFNSGMISANAASKKAVKTVSVKIGSKNVTKKTYKMTQGTSAKLKVTVKPAAAKKSITYKSSKKGVATVSKKGKVTAKAAGTAKITVTVKGKNGKKKSTWLKVSVAGAASTTTTTAAATTAAATATTEVQVSQVVVAAAKTSLNVGDVTQATATVVPATAKTTLKWSSSNTAVATVDDKGGILAVGAGNAVITATAANGVSGKVTITVNEVAVTGIQIVNADGEALTDGIKLTEGSKTTLTAEITPKNATVRTYTWSSTDAKVATVNADGQIVALKEGTTTIKATSTDGGFVSSVEVTVTKKSNEDVNKMSLSVTNALEGYDNTVLVGDNATISVEATNNGVPYDGDVQLAIDEDNSTGYYDYYTLDKDSVELGSPGQKSFPLKLKSEYKKTAQIKDWSSDLAYANIAIKATAGGANITGTINVSMAQIDVETASSLSNYYNNRILTVENQYDPELNSIETANSKVGVRAVRAGTDSDSELYQEYVVEQQQSDYANKDDHKVVLDAAPLLIRAAEKGAQDSSKYDVSVENGKIEEYSVYAGEDKNVKLEKVPGGFNDLTLTFNKLQLSEYSRVVIQAYEYGTDIPITSAVEYIDAGTTISPNDKNKTKSIGKDIFKNTKNMKYIDLRLYVESYGQVCEDSNVGFELVSAKGQYQNQEEKAYEPTSMTDVVEWKVEKSTQYDANTKLENAQTIMGSKYKSNAEYTINMPNGNYEGNAIITEKLGDSIQYYMVPTQRNSVTNLNELVSYPSSYVFEASVEQVTDLTDGFTAEKDELGRFCVDTENVGCMQIVASVNVFGKVKYEANTSITWAPKPTNEVQVTDDYYALAGQNVILQAKVTSKAGKGSVVPNVPVTFYRVEQGKMTDDVIASGKTDSFGKFTYTIQNENAANEYQEVYAQLALANENSYNVEFTIGEQKVETGHKANIHWVKPGLYYQAKADATEYMTADATELVTVEEKAQYKSDTTWLVGTKVAASLSEDDSTYEDDEKEIVNISNITIDYEPTSKVNAEVTKTDVSNGVVRITTKGIGEYDLTAYIDKNVTSTPVITLANGQKYVSVGSGTSFVPGASLKIPVVWVYNESNLSIVNQNMSYAIGNTYLTDGDEENPTNYIENYLKVEDKNGNAVTGTQVTYSVLNSEKGTVLSGTEKTDENGIVTIQIAVPENPDLYTISANITGLDDVKTTTVNFTKPTKKVDGVEVASPTFTKDSVDVNSTEGTVTIKFSDNVGSLATDKNFYHVEDQNGNAFDIKEVEVSQADTSKVILHVATVNASATGLSSSAVVTVKQSYQDNVGIWHYFVNGEGKLLAE